MGKPKRLQVATKLQPQISLCAEPSRLHIHNYLVTLIKEMMQQQLRLKQISLDTPSSLSSVNLSKLSMMNLQLQVQTVSSEPSVLLFSACAQLTHPTVTTIMEST